ncbi:MAG: hypothetical protein ACRD2H_13860 [Terriglobales bacterium]
MFGPAWLRLLERALLAGAATFATNLSSSATLDRSAVIGAATAAIWVAVEYFTPINHLIGPKGGNA